MSIINDALKKAQQNLSLKAGKDTVILDADNKQTLSANQNTQANKTISNPQPKPQGKNDSPTNLAITFFLFGIVCSLLTVLVFVLKQSLSKQLSTIKESVLVESRRDHPAQMPTKLSPKETSIPSKENTISFKVKGIMEMENKKLALINDKILSVGDSVEGYKITNITLQRVELTSETGETINVDVRAK